MKLSKFKFEEVLSSGFTSNEKMNSLSFKIWVNLFPEEAIKFLKSQTEIAINNLLEITKAKVNNSYKKNIKQQAYSWNMLSHFVEGTLTSTIPDSCLGDLKKHFE